MSDFHSLDQNGERMVGYTRLGDMYFDVPRISPITDNLHQGGSPQGKLAKYSAIVDLYGEVQYRPQAGTALMYVQMYDAHGAVDDELVTSIAGFVNAMRRKGTVLVLCQAGLNRSSLISARALMLEGASADEAIELLRTKRSPACLCNTDFEDYLRGIL